MPGSPRLRSASLPKLAALAVIVVAVPIAAFAPVDIRAVVAVVALCLMAISAVGHDDRLAWWWGLLIPVEIVKGVPNEVFDVARYGGLIWLCVRFAPDLSAARRPYVVKLAVLVASIATIRGVGSLARADRFGMYIAAVMFLGAVTAPFLAWRVRSHVSIMAGFMAGTLITATVSIMQAIEIPTFRDGNMDGDRYPGLASTTMLITWHLAFGLIIAVYFIAGRRHPPLHRITAFALVPMGLAATVVNGATGGLLGLAAAALAVGLWGWRRISWRMVAPYVAGAMVLLVLVTGVLLVAGVATPSLDGLRGEDNYTNELARWTVAKQGFREMVAHPLVGVGRTNFVDEYGLAPHFLPLEGGITAGVVAFAVGMYLLWCLLAVVIGGPVGRRPASWLGLALCAAMFANTLTETGGPFTGLPRFTLCLIAVIACRGEPWAADDEAFVEGDEPVAQDEQAAAY